MDEERNNAINVSRWGGGDKLRTAGGRLVHREKRQDLVRSLRKSHKISPCQQQNTRNVSNQSTRQRFPLHVHVHKKQFAPGLRAHDLFPTP